MTNYIIDISSAYVWAFAVGIFLMKCWHSWLSWKNKSYILETEGNAKEVIGEIDSRGVELFTEEKLKKSMQYSRFSEAFGRLNSKITTMITQGIFLIGLTPCMLHFFNMQCGLSFWLSLFLWHTAMNAIDIIVEYPFSWYRNFRLEDKFGFNNMTMKTFNDDKIKSFIISTITFAIMSFVAVKLLELYHAEFGKVDVIFCLGIACISPIFSLIYELIDFKFIDPLFNKLSKLENESLTARIDKMMQDAGYKVCNVFVVDTSKRSKHSNAYFAGWGKSKRLVLSDTLLSTMSDDEVLAIVGHELGHAKCHHLVISRIMSMFGTFIFLWAGTFMMYNIDLMHAFGYRFITTDEMAMTYALIGLALFTQVWGAFSWIFDGLSSYISQKMEYAADAMSAKFMKTSDAMVSSLFKLYVDNMSYPLVDKMFEMWNYSHPSLLNRVKALKKLDAEENKEEEA